MFSFWYPLNLAYRYLKFLALNTKTTVESFLSVFQLCLRGTMTEEAKEAGFMSVFDEEAVM